MRPTLQERYQGSLLGLACGDAVGTTVEFQPRGSFPPLTDLVGGGPFHLKAGQWTDDTSMALCLAQSLLHCRGFDALDQMQRYLDWQQHGHLSSTGYCFDIGMTVSEALERFSRTGEPYAGSTDPRKAGNGSLMRLAPVVLFFHPDEAAVLHFSARSSLTTHGAPEAVQCCQVLGLVLSRCLGGLAKDEVLDASGLALSAPKVQAIACRAYLAKAPSKVKGSGYAVESLEAALWCFHTTDSFEAAVLAAANLGDDADTTAAIVGQVAGAFYGVRGIPGRWRERLHMRDEIVGMADALYAAAQARLAAARTPQPGG